CSGATSLPVVLLMRLYPTGSMLRSSSQSKSIPLLVVAETSETGICTSPKLMAPFQIARAMTDLPDDAGTALAPCLRMPRTVRQKLRREAAPVGTTEIGR